MKHFQKVAALTEWAAANGAVLNPAIEVYDDECTGISFRVGAGRGPIEPGAEIVSCPMGLTLSYLNLLEELPSGFRRHCQVEATVGSPTQETQNPVFPARFIKETPPHVLSRFVLMHEFEHKPDSFWAPYLDTLPWPVDWNQPQWAADVDRENVDVMEMLPPFWPSEDRELFDGTNIAIPAREIATRVRAEWMAATLLLESLDPETPWPSSAFSEQRHQWAFCVFSTRSFRPSPVVPDPEALQSKLPEGVTLRDFSILLPLFDIGNHDMMAEVAWEASGSGCTLKTQERYRAGEQVFNNYDKKTNSELLLAYGFMLPETEALHNDYVHLRKFRKQEAEPEAAQVVKQNNNATEAAPTEFLISLRPITDPSSACIRARQLVDRTQLAGPVVPSFAHVEDAMVWDIVAAQTTLRQRAELFNSGAVRELYDVGKTLEGTWLALFLTGRFEPGGVDVFEMTVATIYHKIMLELEKLAEADFEGDGEEGNPRERLARDYRARCRRVLETALESITGGDDEGEE